MLYCKMCSTEVGYGYWYRSFIQDILYFPYAAYAQYIKRLCARVFAIPYGAACTLKEKGMCAQKQYGIRMCFHNTDIARIRGIFTDACARFSKYGEGRVCVKKYYSAGAKR